MHPFLNEGCFIAFAHRGGAHEAPENSFEAFAYAIGLGYRYIETDVQLTSDGVVVVFHDDVLDRVTDGTGPISEHSWAEVSALRIHGKGRIPRLEEVFEEWPEVFFNIDAKTDAVAGPLCDVAATDNLDRLCLASANDKRLGFIRDRFGERVCTNLGMAETARVLLPALIGLPSLSAAGDCLQLPPKAYGLPAVGRATLKRAKVLGLPIHVWTIDDEAEMERIIDLGAHGIMTDRPKLLRTILKKRGLWS